MVAIRSVLYLLFLIALLLLLWRMLDMPNDRRELMRQRIEEMKRLPGRLIT